MSNMSYNPISVKEAINKINANHNGWFLPAIQRTYVWGSRYESQKYICKLFDSIFKGYPIGTLIVWNSSTEIAHKEFMNDYKDEGTAQLVEKGKWGRDDKWLVYDGQQRLQTLHSCLKYSFNGNILVFNLLFNPKEKEDVEDTGFMFVKSNSQLDSNLIKMNQLFTQNPKNKIKYRGDILNKKKWSQEEKILIEENIESLWDIFVKENMDSLAYFSISTKDESEVNEIFQRLNSGGVPLSQSDLLLSRIKEKCYDFEERLQSASREIFNLTGKGYVYDTYHILQILSLFVKGAVRVDPKKVKKEELNKFVELWENLETPLKEFFEQFIYGQFKINNSSIVPRNLCLLPLIAYIYELSRKGIPFRKINESNLTLMKKYFIQSQINDWNLQSYIDNFFGIIVEESKKNKGHFKFPLKEFEEFIKKKGFKRYIEVSDNVFEDYIWFSLKILTPNRIYQFDSNINRRFNPEIGHIFPMRLKNQNDKYRKNVNVLWNLQPVKGDINGFKLNHHPLEFFTNKVKDSKGILISGGKYFSEYDFLPDLKSKLWKNYRDFIPHRKEKMKEFFKDKYGLEFKKNR